MCAEVAGDAAAGAREKIRKLVGEVAAERGGEEVVDLVARLVDGLIQPARGSGAAESSSFKAWSIMRWSWLRTALRVDRPEPST